MTTLFKLEEIFMMMLLHALSMVLMGGKEASLPSSSSSSRPSESRLFSVDLQVEKIRLIESNAKQIDLYKDSAAGVSSVLDTLPPYDPYPSPFTLYTCIKYTYSHGGGGR